jgi:RimJ/RimL family protein N-acetyltransferase
MEPSGDRGLPVTDATRLLRDGTVVRVRSMQPDDAEALVRFHDSLAAETTRMRFFTVHPHLTVSETTRFTTVDHADREAFVAEVDGQIIGVGRFERGRDRDEGEVAFVVADAWQGRGVAPMLLAFLVHHARSLGLRRLVAQTLTDNHPMLKVFSRSGLPMSRAMAGGVVDVTLTL